MNVGIGPDHGSVALVVITFNEESVLGRCLESASGIASRIIVVDSGSTDRTREIAGASGADVRERVFDGYGRQKQFALELADTDWALCLDADEWLDDEAQQAIRSALAQPPPPDVTGFRLQMRTRYLGRWMRHSRWLSRSKLRLVRRGAARWKDDVVHEGLELMSGRAGNLRGRILHEPYEDLGDELRKIDRYTALIADRDRHTPLVRVLLGMTIEPPLVFVHKYLLELGILDGLRGFIASCMTALYFFVRYARIWQRKGTE